MPKPNHNKKYLKRNRKELRNNLTSAEATLWSMLKNKKLDGRKFRRQHSIDNFIVDFYCPKEKLIIELDGDIHFNPICENADYLRDKILKNYGLKVLRFENKVVFQQPEIILNAIKNCFDD